MLAGCSKLPPAGFWKNFDSRHIINKTSQQGLGGGHRTIYWENAAKYKDSDILKFAADNEWTLISSKTITAGESWVKYPGKMYIFDSEWTKVVNGKDQVAYGYLLVSTDHTKLTFYHSWGK